MYIYIIPVVQKVYDVQVHRTTVVDSQHSQQRKRTAAPIFILQTKVGQPGLKLITSGRTGAFCDRGNCYCPPTYLPTLSLRMAAQELTYLPTLGRLAASSPRAAPALRGRKIFWLFDPENVYFPNI